MLDILTKENSKLGPVQISVGIRVDLPIYQVRINMILKKKRLPVDIFQVRGYKPAPVAWPGMAAEVDQLGERMARWTKCLAFVSFACVFVCLFVCLFVISNKIIFALVIIVIITIKIIPVFTIYLFVCLL